MSFAAALLLFLPLSLDATPPDRLMGLVGEMLRLGHTGDYAAVGRLAPAVLEELAKPHPKAAVAWNQVGAYFHAQGDYLGAERAYVRGIRLIEQGDSAGELEVLLSNLATLYLETRQRPAHAEVLCRRALKRAVEVHGAASPELANFLHVLGAARQQQGDRQDARRFFQQAFDLSGNSSLVGRVRQGSILANLAFLSAQDRQWAQARDSLLQSIALVETALGPSHPDLVRSYLNLARVYRQLKQWTPAYASVVKAREITEARLGADHPLMAEILETSAYILRKTGRGREGRELGRRAREIAKAQPKNSASHASIHVADLMRSGGR